MFIEEVAACFRESGNFISVFIPKILPQGLVIKSNSIVFLVPQNSLIFDGDVIISELPFYFIFGKFLVNIIVYPRVVVFNRHPAERALAILFFEGIKTLFTGSVVIRTDESGYSSASVEDPGADVALMLLFEDLGIRFHEVICCLNI